MMKNEYISKGYFWAQKNTFPEFKTVLINTQPNDIIIKVKASMFGKALYRAITGEHPKLSPPMFLGSLIAGEVIDSDSNDTIGMRVVLNPHATCMVCEECRNGMYDQCIHKVQLIPCGISPIVCVRNNTKNALFQIPDNVSFEHAVYTELIACALEALENARMHSQNILIIGCGLMGLIMTKMAYLLDFKKIFCIYNKNNNRKKIIENANGIPIWYSGNTIEMKKIVQAEIGNDIFSVIEAVGNKECFNLALDLAKPKSCIILFGGYNKTQSEAIVNLNKIHYHNIKIQGSYHFSPDKFEKAIELLRSNRLFIDDLITKKYRMNTISNVFFDTYQTESISNVIVFD